MSTRLAKILNSQKEILGSAPANPMKCGICGASPKGKRLASDHCHVTGAKRGYLCMNCNTGLGHFRDRTDLLEKAIAYLKRSRVCKTHLG